MSNSLDPDQGRRFVAPDLGLNCLHTLLADGTSRQRVSLCALLLTTCATGKSYDKIKVLIKHPFLTKYDLTAKPFAVIVS